MSTASTIEKLGEFISKHTGEVILGLQAFGAVFGGGEPDKDAHKLIKMVHGGLWSWEDEVATYGIEVDLRNGKKDDPNQPDEAKRKELVTSLVTFRDCVREVYGKGKIGHFGAEMYLHRLRMALVRMRAPSRVDVKTVDKQVGKGKTVPLEVKETVAPNNDLAVAFLTDLAEEFQRGASKHSGGDVAKRRAGYRAACAFLKNRSFPVPTLVDLAKKADKTLDDMPALKGKASGMARSVDNWVTTTAAANRQQENNLPRHRRWFRKML
ncbi:MAG: hypothetical protein KC877_05115 [Candidatus Kaiserbacteria bacterium]|nr:hypothetical protein [Candidatus Kaiserbacteria bacterium]